MFRVEGPESSAAGASDLVQTLNSAQPNGGPRCLVVGRRSAVIILNTLTDYNDRSGDGKHCHKTTKWDALFWRTA